MDQWHTQKKGGNKNREGTNKEKTNKEKSGTTSDNFFETLQNHEGNEGIETETNEKDPKLNENQLEEAAEEENKSQQNEGEAMHTTQDLDMRKIEQK